MLIFVKIKKNLAGEVGERVERKCTDVNSMITDLTIKRFHFTSVFIYFNISDIIFYVC